MDCKRDFCAEPGRVGRVFRADTARLSWEIYALLIGAAGLVVVFFVRMVIAWKCYHHIDPTAGTWTAAAIDAAHGTLYRPIYSSLGFGGSRYAPLHIVLQAGLIRAGLGPVAAGYLLDLFGILLVVLGLFALMRQLGVSTWVAISVSPFVLAAYCFDTTAAGIKGDLIPAGLNLWGLAAVVKGCGRARPASGAAKRVEGGFVVVAALCFVLAAATKLTSIFGIGTAVVWLASKKQLRGAALLAVLWVVGVICAAGLTQWASDGRAFHIFRLCAAGGGGIGALLRGPHRLIWDAVHNDRFFVCFCILAGVLILLRRQWLSLPTILFVLTALGTVAIYGSPGTNANHLVDLQAAAVLVLAVNISVARWIPAVAIALVLFSIVNSAMKAVSIAHEDRHAKMLAALADTRGSINTTGPLLAENPILPILAGERPYMLDSFMFRVVWRHDPAIAAPFFSDLAERRFRAVILSSDLSDLTASDSNFGSEFVDVMKRNYDLVSVHGDLRVYLPKSMRDR